MKNENKIVELLADPLKRLDQMVGMQSETNSRLERLEIGFGRHEKAINRIAEELVKLNTQTVQNTRARFTLADKVDRIADLNNRVVKLERAVFK